MIKRFTIKELERWIDTELNALRYYGLREDRYKLSEDSDIYRDLRSIGYCKRTMKLDRRCVPVLITSDIEIISSTKIEDLYVVYTFERDGNFTPCEIFIKLYPDRKMEILNILKSTESNPSTTIEI